jgi:hypothetical protein
MCTYSEHSMECSTVFSICNYPITLKVPNMLPNDCDVSDFESEPEPKRVRTDSENESGAQRVVVAPSMKQNYYNL